MSDLSNRLEPLCAGERQALGGFPHFGGDLVESFFSTNTSHFNAIHLLRGRSFGSYRTMNYLDRVEQEGTKPHQQLPNVILRFNFLHENYRAGYRANFSEFSP